MTTLWTFSSNTTWKTSSTWSRSKLPVLDLDLDGSQSRSVQLESSPVPGRFRSLPVQEAQALELLDPAVARGDRNSEPATEFDGRRRPLERSQQDARGIVVHDRLGHLQSFHESLLPFERKDSCDEARDLVRLERLVEIADRPAAHALALGERGAERRHQDCPQPGLRAARGLDELDPVRARHPEVGQK